MTRQKSERREVLQARRKLGVTEGLESPRGGKATPVEQQIGQLKLNVETAENRTKVRVVDGTDAGRPAPVPIAAPKSTFKRHRVQSVTMEAVRRAIDEAFHNVASNKGASGPDGQSVEHVREHWLELGPQLDTALQEGSYEPGNIRRVWIPKAGGGERGLGIPNVIDRVVAESVRLVLEPLYEPTFHPSSHGFRPGRSCHTALDEARGYLEEGYEWVVDLDLENFFNRVHHQRLMAKLAERVHDKRLLVLIGQMLKANVVMPNGVVVSTDEGVPQGGPLSPLLSNVVLDELDRELDRRGHRFVRYADDSNIYVRSERAGQRVMASVVSFIEGRMRLKVNRTKSAVAKPEERHFLGFRLRCEPMTGDVQVLLSKRSSDQLDAKVRELTPRNWGGSLEAAILQLNEYLVGWLGFFRICTAPVKSKLQAVDAHIRRRLRAMALKDCKRKRGMARKLIGLGVKPKAAWRGVYDGRKSIWALSHTPAVERGFRNAYFAERGLVSLLETWEVKPRYLVASAQLLLRLG